jgi:hypothetical protein
MTRELVDVAPIRVACEKAMAVRQFESWAAIAAACGYIHSGSTKGDVSRLRRRLGATQCDGRKSMHISYEVALLIVNALGLDPVDFDL